MTWLLFELAGVIALLPLGCLYWLRQSGQHRSPGHWWLAGAMAVSFLADLTAHWIDPWIVASVYPISQCALAAAVLGGRKRAAWLLGTSVWLIPLWEGTIARIVGNVMVARYAWHHKQHGMIRAGLLVYFGLGVVAWCIFLRWAGWPTWGAYQGVRFAGLMVLTWAFVKEQRLVLVRSYGSGS